MSPEIVRLCGTTIPPPVISTGNSVYLIFTTDLLTVYTGWKITWEAINPGELSTNN